MRSRKVVLADKYQHKYVGKMKGIIDTESGKDAVIAASVVNGGDVNIVFEGMAGTLEKLMGVCAINLIDQMKRDEADKDRGLDEFCDLVRDVYLLSKKEEVQEGRGGREGDPSTRAASVGGAAQDDIVE